MPTSSESPVDKCRDWVVVARTGRPGRPEHLTERLTLQDAVRQCAELEARGMPGLVRRIRARAPLDLTPDQEARLRRLARTEDAIKDHARTLEVHIANLTDFAAWLTDRGQPLAKTDTADLSATMLPPPTAEHAAVLALAAQLRDALARYAAATWGLSGTLHLERELVRLSAGRRGPQAATQPVLDRVLEGVA